MNISPRRFLSTLVLSVLLAGLTACEQQPAATPASISQGEPLTLGLPLHPTSALALVAWKKGFFTEEGLDILVKEYPSGKLALQAMLAGECDIATTASIPVATTSLKNRDFRILATLANVTDVYRVVARTDLGIQTPADLRGKRVATQRASAVHFFLHLFLLQHNLNEKDIELSFLPATALPSALESGAIDAFSMREPFVSQARDLLGDRVVIFSSPGLYDSYELLVARKDIVDNSPDRLLRVVRALVRAEIYSRSHPEPAQQAVAEALGVERESIRQLWPALHLELYLPQSLVISLEDEAAWAKRENVEGDPPANFLDLFWPEALTRAKPDGISIIPLERL